MGVTGRLCEVAGVHACYSCVLYLLPVVHRTETMAVTTPAGQADKQSSQSDDDDDMADMVKGLAAGFGFFFGLIILVCLVWCLCCGNVCNSKSDGSGPEKRLRSKVSPSPPRSANVRTRATPTCSP